MTNYIDVLKYVADYVSKTYKQHPQKELTYHNLEHISNVLVATEQIGAHYQLPEQDFFIVLCAAWMHDLGYLFVKPADHVDKSITLATGFLNEHLTDNLLIEKIISCIKSTEMPQSPKNLLEEIVCDADLFHLGLPDFTIKSKKFRNELENVLGQKINGANWRSTTIQLLEKHQFFTLYCQTLLNSGKQQNINLLKLKSEEKAKKGSHKVYDEANQLTNAAGDESAIGKTDTNHVKELKAGHEEQKNYGKTGRGVETMFRITSANHLQLSEMADNKANIMISVNSIIISIIVSVLFRRLEDSPQFIIPTTLFVISSLLTIVFSVLATRPTITIGKFSKEDIIKKRSNLLFFGNFHKMSLEDYEWGISEMMKDNTFLYGSMTRDIYFLGVVLGNKYKLLRLAYNIFMFGFVLSVLTFTIAALFFKND